MAQTIFEVFSAQVRRLFEDPPDYLPRLPAGDLTPQLDALDAAAQQLANAADLGAWLASAVGFRNAYENLANQAFGGTPQQAREDLVARYLLTQFPRAAAALLTLGIITPTTDTGVNPPVMHYRLDRQKLGQLVQTPEALLNEQTWDDLFADLNLPDAGRLPAILAGLLIMAPRTLIALAHGDLKVAPLPPPATRSDPISSWGKFRQVSEDWISGTFPFADPLKPADQQKPPNKFSYQADLEPDLSATLGIRSRRFTRPGGQRVTDFELWLAFGIDQDLWEYEPWENWFLRVQPGLTAGFGKDGTSGDWHGAFAPLNVNSPLLPARPDDPVTISFDREVPGGAPDLMFGPPYDTRFVIQDLGAWIKLREAEPVFEIAFRIKELEAVLAPRWFRLFGQTNESFADGLRFTLDFDFVYGVGRGVSLNLASGLEFVWTLDKQLGSDRLNVKLHSLRFIVELLVTQNGFQARLCVRIHASGQIGPLGLVIDGPGAWGGYWPDDNGEMDYWGLLPPTGAGLSLEIGPIMVGGFLDWTGGPSERYAGLLYAKLWFLEIIAFGIHEKTPQGRTSVIVVLGAHFQPGIQLGFGFAITGVGGLLGVNRRVDTDALRERLTSGATGNVLFAPDPVKSAPGILGDLGALFPAEDNVHVGGPTLQISWITIVRLDIGIVFEIAVGTNAYGTTGLTKIVVLGVARIKVAVGPLAVVDIRMDVVGFVDFVKSVIEFDATLYNSRFMIMFILVGDAAFRLSWGSSPYAMIALGGFHPEFNPEPAMFPEMARLGLAYDPGSVGYWFRLEFYFALTTNTIQTGGKIEVGIKGGPFNAVGWLAADLLIQFRPFYFTVSVSAGFRVRFGSTTLCGVRFSGTLTGPTPLTLTGEICIEVLFFDICWSDSISIGEGSGPDAVEPVSSLRQALAQELSDPENLQAIGNDDKLVTTHTQALQNACVVVSPIGRLQWTQKRAPLNCLIERFEGAPLTGPQAVVVSSPAATGDTVTDWFSPGSFTTLNNSEALNRAGFERLEAGLVLGFGMKASDPVAVNIVWQNFLLPKEPILIKFLSLFPSLVLDSIYGRTAAVSQFDRKPAAIQIKAEGWSLHQSGGGVALSGLSQTDAHQRARYGGTVAVPDNDMVVLGGV